jgi:EF hand
MRLSTRPLLSATLAALFCAAGTTAQAQGQTTPPPPSTLEPSGAMTSMAQLDLNRDGFVDKSEVPSGNELAGKFARLDSNSDGKLDAEEFARYQAEKR